MHKLVSGEYTEHFLRGGYAAIGWEEVTQDLGAVKARDEIHSVMRSSYPDVGSTIVINSGWQLSRKPQRYRA